MHEVCFCGWTGALAEREPTYLGDGAWGLTCPGCGRPDDLTWLPAEAAGLTVADACRRHEERTSAPPSNVKAEVPPRAA